MAINILKAIDKEHQNKTLKELLDTPVAAISGISEAGGKLLAEKFNVKTIGDLANWKFAVWARAIQDLAKVEVVEEKKEEKKEEKSA